MESESRPEERIFLPVIQQLIERTELATGRRIRIATNHKLDGGIRAQYAVSESDDQSDLIRVAASELEHIDHLVAHELGHVRHLADAPEVQRTTPVVSRRVRLNAGHLLTRELQTLVNRGLPSALVQPLMERWTNSLVSQLADTPPDIAIEQSIWKDEPGLRVFQEASLRRQVDMMTSIAEPAARALLPPTVYRATAAMSYALARIIADILADPSLVAPYAGTAAESTGESLLVIYEAQRPDSLADFRNVSTEWANALELQGLLEFRPVSEVRR